MSAAGVRLGVDFGTSTTVAVLRWSDGRARPLLFDGSPLLPSAVYAEPTGGALVVGRDAVHSARLDPGRFEPNPKRRIDDGELLLGDREVPLVEAVTAVLARVTEELRRTAGAAPVETTLTCPASWGATRRLVLADAALAAGMGQVRMVAEPVAAATYFTQVLGREVPIGSVVVVYDFGAGTIDASVVARTSTGFEVLAVDGRDDIGGLDVDAAVVELVGKVCAERDAEAWARLVNPTTVEERRARRLLWDDARSAKERLSRHPSAELTVPLLNLDVHVTRQELEERSRSILDQTVRVTQGVMRWANLAEGRVAGVFLVGGSSRIPLVATLLHRALGEAPVAIEQPELVVAEGSLLAGAAALPGAAGAAPGPSTSEFPVRPVSPGAAGSQVPVSVPPAASATPPATGVSPSAASVSPSAGYHPAGMAALAGAPGVISATPGSAAPVSPGGDARSVGRVAVPGSPVASPSVAPTRPMPRYDPPAPPKPPTYRAGAGRQGAGPPAAAPKGPPGYPPAEHRSAGAPAYRPPRRGGGVVRAVRVLLMILILLAVPVVSAYVAYKVTVNEGLLPLRI
jgi:hypothetical protein